MKRSIDFMKNETRDAKWLVDNYEKNQLVIDNSFQRKYVWTLKHQVRLIESILLGYTIPEIYLWEEDTNPDTGETIYSIVDGQQRIGALFQFIKGEFELKEKYLDKKSEAYCGKHFSELDTGLKKLIWRYPFSIRFIYNNVTKDEIKEMFLRLNSNNMTLNPQELRNAEFDGLFLKLSQEMSENKFWDKYGIFTPLQRRRMQDIEFISTILLFLRGGINEDVTQTNLNKAYDLYNEIYEEYELDKKTFVQILKEISILFDTKKDSIKFFEKQTHLYTLIVYTYYIISKDLTITPDIIGKINKFLQIYNEEIKGTSTENKLVNEYKLLSQEGTKSKKNRMRRFQIFKEFIGY